MDPEPTFDVVAALSRMVDAGASDLLLKAGNRPLIRVDGQLVALDRDGAELRPRDTEHVLESLLPTHRIADFERSNELDFAYGVRGLGRFRVNAYRQRGTIALVLRAVSAAVATIAELGLPEVTQRLAEESRGLVLVTGTAGSGRSTTVAAMLAHINATAHQHIITIEDPIEYLFRDDRASIDQREVGVDTESVQTALRQVVRQNADVIFVDGLRDAETVATACAAADAGHLVISTLVATDAPDAVNRLVDLFEPEAHHDARAMLASALKGVICQRLVPTTQPGRRVAVTEVMTVTQRVHDALLNPRRSAELAGIIAEGAIDGMHTFAQAFHETTVNGRVALHVALRYTSNPQDLKLLAATSAHAHAAVAEERPQVAVAELPGPPIAEPPRAPSREPAVAGAAMDPARPASTPPPSREGSHH